MNSQASYERLRKLKFGSCDNQEIKQQSNRHLRIQSQQWKHQNNMSDACSKLTIKTPKQRH